MQQAVRPVRSLSSLPQRHESDAPSTIAGLDLTTALFLVLATSVILIAIWWLVTATSFLSSSVVAG